MSLLSNLVQSQKLVSLSSNDSVLDAVVLMAEHLVGSVVVIDNNQLCGIFSERDLLNRVVSKELDIKQTKLGQVMTKEVCTIDASASVQDCYQKMEATKCRHLPIVDNNQVVGMVTMRNILEWLIQEMKDENIHLKHYIQS